METRAQGAEDPSAELLELGAATIGEAGGRPMNPRLRPVWAGARLCGPALTVSCSPGDNLPVHVAVAHATAGSVLVVSVGDDEEHGYWGEVLTTAALARELAGLVIQGGVRDTDAVARLGFPIFSTMTALAGTTKNRSGAVGTTVEVGGTTVSTGDWLVADEDGVVVVDRGDLAKVMEAARARAQKESRLFDELRAGRTTLELLALDPSSVDVQHVGGERPR